MPPSPAKKEKKTKTKTNVARGSKTLGESVVEREDEALLGWAQASENAKRLAEMEAKKKK